MADISQAEYFQPTAQREKFVWGSGSLCLFYLLGEQKIIDQNKYPGKNTLLPYGTHFPGGGDGGPGSREAAGDSPNYQPGGDKRGERGACFVVPERMGRGGRLLGVHLTQGRWNYLRRLKGQQAGVPAEQKLIGSPRKAERERD